MSYDGGLIKAEKNIFKKLLTNSRLSVKIVEQVYKWGNYALFEICNILKKEENHANL